MLFENSTSDADGTAHSGLEEKMSSVNSTLTTASTIRHFSSPEKLSNSPPKGNGKGNVDKNGHGAALANLQTGEFGQGVSAEKNLVTQPASHGQSLGAVPLGFILPVDHDPSNGQFFAEALLSVQLDDPLKSQILDLAHDHNSDLATAALVAWITVLSRLCSQESIVLEVGGVSFKGTVNVSVDLSGELDTSKLFERVKHALGAASTSQSALDDPITLSGTDGEPTLCQASFFSYIGRFPQPLKGPLPMQCLELHLSNDKGDVTLGIRYAADLFNKNSIERYLGYLQAVLTNMVIGRGQPVALFDILSKDEKKLLLETWHETDADYPADRCAHHLFEDQVDNSPHAVAVVHGEKELTYLELNAMANHLAHQLTRAGIKHGDFVALLFERSIELVVIVLAVLKVGAAYVPIDTRTPADRLAYILSDTASKMLVTSEGTSVPDQIVISVLRFNADKEKMGYEQVSSHLLFQISSRPNASMRCTKRPAR